MDWRHHARCIDHEPELFFSVGESGPARNQDEQAKAVCRHCPVREQCLNWALNFGQDEGVWGGLSARERRDLRRHGREAGALRASRVR